MEGFLVEMDFLECSMKNSREDLFKSRDGGSDNFRELTSELTSDSQVKGDRSWPYLRVSAEKNPTMKYLLAIPSSANPSLLSYKSLAQSPGINSSNENKKLAR